MDYPLKLQGKDSPFSPKGIRSPERLFLLTIAGIFLAEVVSMIVVYIVQPGPYWLQTLLDAMIMTILIFPLIYYFSFRFLLQQIQVRKRSEALLLNVLESMPVGVWITDAEGKIIHGNPAGQELWGGARLVGIEGYGEYRARRVGSDEWLRPEEWAAVRTVRTGESVLNEEIEIETFDGDRKYMLNSSVPILEEGAILGAIVINQDITRRKQNTEALIHSNELLKGVFNSVEILIAHMDRDFNFIQVNNTYAKLGGHPVEFFPGKNHFDLFPNAENQAIFENVVRTGEPYSVLEKPFEYPEFPERGVTYWDWKLQPIRHLNGSIQGLVLSLLDVTKRKRAEVKLEERNQELRALYNAEYDARRASETLTAAAMALTQSMDQEQILRTMMEHIDKIIPSDTSGVTLLYEQGQSILFAAHGFPDGIPTGQILKYAIGEIPAAVFERLIAPRRYLLVADAHAAPIFTEIPELADLRSWLLVPLIAQENVIGIVGMGKKQPGFYTYDHVQWVEALTNQATVAIQNAWLFDQVRTSSDRLQLLTRKLVDIQEKERLYVARELHDDAGQALTSIKIGLGRLEQSAECPEVIRDRLQELKAMADGVMENLHQLAMNLRPAALDHLGLVPALEQYASSLRSVKLKVEFKSWGFDGNRLSPPVETALYRIAQEALTNVVRHAQAATVGILLERRPGKVILFIEDDGRGFDPELAESSRLGLVGMQERAVLIGGNLSIESVVGKGTSIRVEVPDVAKNHYR